jgi:hypothetical protein
MSAPSAPDPFAAFQELLMAEMNQLATRKLDNDQKLRDTREAHLVGGEGEGDDATAEGTPRDADDRASDTSSKGGVKHLSPEMERCFAKYEKLFAEHFEKFEGKMNAERQQQLNKFKKLLEDQRNERFPVA